MKTKRALEKAFRDLRETKRENLLTGGFLFTAGAIAMFPSLNYFLNSLAADGFSRLTSDWLIADTIISLLILLPSLALFSIGYMLLKGHSMGRKMSLAACIGTCLLFGVNVISLELAVPVAFLTAIATMLEYFNLRIKKTVHKDSPTTTENVAKLGMFISAAVCIVVLIFLFAYAGIRGAPYLTWDFLTNLNWSWSHASAVLNGIETGSMGGVLGYVIGSLLLASLCEVIAIPLGLGAAIFLSEYAKQNKLTEIIRFFIETLAGIPSIIIGLLALGFFVLGGLGLGPSLIGGAMALALMILPWNIRVVEESIKSVPQSYREASFALGATQWQTVRNVVLFAASPGIITGILLGLGAALGETIVVAMASNGVVGGPQVLPALNQLFLPHTTIPALPVFLWRAQNLLTMGQFQANELTVFNMYSVIFAAAFVLIALYLAICVVALVLRNYLNKKITGK
jgi:phosphate transport system permease protein